jgi:group I intron endonuclease
LYNAFYSLKKKATVVRGQLIVQSVNTPCNLFDLEVLLLFPAAVSMYSLGQSGFWILLFFLVVLTVGFVYEYASGALNYTNKNKDSELPPVQSSILIKNIYQPRNISKFNIREFSSVSNKNEFKDYWLNIKPVSKWYYLDENGNSIDYTNEFKEINGIYIYRLIKEPWKCYVGSTESLSKRLTTHRWAFTNSINTENSSVPLFYNAIQKYGWESFEIAVLEIVPIVELSNRENYYLSFKPYYNLKYFLDGKVQHSDVIRAQISESVLGINNPFYGRNHSEISKNNMAYTKFLTKNEQLGSQDYNKALELSKKSSLSKFVYQLSKDKKEVINTFPSIGVASIFFKTNRTTIRKYLDTNILYGNQWFLTSNLNKDPEQQIYIINNSSLDQSIYTPVYQYLIDKNSVKLINTFFSIATAAHYFEVTISGLI